MTPPPADWICLRSDALTVHIDPQGAQLSVLRDVAGTDLLWDGDPAFWSGRAPILFPIVGELNAGHYRFRDQRYPLSRHGFARGRRFDGVQRGPHQALFRLCSDEATLAVYPFRFELEVAYALEGDALGVTLSVRNVGDEPLPASLGFHPAFRWPLAVAGHGAKPRAAYALDFALDEPAPVRRLDASGLLTPERHPTPVVGKRLLLDDELFGPDVVIFDALQSRSVRYGAGEGAQIEVSFPDASYLGIWSKPGAGFVCIEPWRGVADPAGFAGEIVDKPGMLSVAPGAEAALHMGIRWIG